MDPSKRLIIQIKCRIKAEGIKRAIASASIENWSNGTVEKSKRRRYRGNSEFTYFKWNYPDWTSTSWEIWIKEDRTRGRAKVCRQAVFLNQIDWSSFCQLLSRNGIEFVVGKANQRICVIGESSRINLRFVSRHLKSNGTITGVTPVKRH